MSRKSYLNNSPPKTHKSSNSPPRGRIGIIQNQINKSRIESRDYDAELNKLDADEDNTFQRKIRNGVGREIPSRERYDPEKRASKLKQQANEDRLDAKRIQDKKQVDEQEQYDASRPPSAGIIDDDDILVTHEQIAIYDRPTYTPDSNDSSNEGSRTQSPSKRLIAYSNAMEPSADEKNIVDTAADLVRLNKQTELSREITTNNQIVQNALDQGLEGGDLLKIVDELSKTIKNSATPNTTLIQFRLQLVEEIRKQNVQQQLMRGQIQRRDVLLEEQREAYLKELMLLREELFKKNNDSAHEPTDYMLHSWVNRTRMAELQDEKERQLLMEQEADRQARLLTKKGMLNHRAMREEEEDRMSFNNLRSQTRKVSETLVTLKKLEMKRKKEIDALRRQQRETDRIRKRLLEREEAGREEAEKEKTERERLERLQQQLLNQQQQLMEMRDLQGTSKDQEERERLLAEKQLQIDAQRKQLEEQTRLHEERRKREDEEKKAFENQSHFNQQHDHNQESDQNDIEDQDERESNHHEEDGTSQNEFVPTIDGHKIEEENKQLNLLENQIFDFQGRFRHLHAQMDII
ncbi:CyaA, partial [Acrasis kona]